MAMPKGYWTIADASRSSGISRAQLSRLLRQGVIKGEKVGPVWLVNIRSLSAYLQDRPRPGRKPRR